jgi:hypothetical protein
MSRRRISSQYYFFDHFQGSNYDNDVWTARGSTGYNVALIENSVVRVRASATNGRYSEIYQGDKGDSSIAGYGRCLFRATLPSIASIAGEVGFKAASPDAGTDWVRFIFDTAVGANWRADTTAASTATTTDTGIVPSDGVYQEFEIVLAPGNVKFFIDGVLVATHTTNLTTKLLQLYGRVTTRTGSTKALYIDFVELWGNRE